MADGDKVENTRLSQYKARKSGSSQEERRKFLLQEQKRLRDEAFNEGRNIIEEINNSLQKPAIQRSRIYKKKFMLSEWLLEIPSDFEDKWIMLPCPVGKRVLVFAGRGMTGVFAKDGRVLSRFRSHLPGGHLDNGEPSKGVTLLDCIWSKCNRSYYILDVLAWNNQHLTNCDAEFRFYWLQTKLLEIENMVEITRNNSYPFYLLPTFHCDRGTLETALNSPLIPDVIVDGLLFYHLQSHYITGHTPLVGWLKPFMIPDMMQINVCQELLVEQPQNYEGYRKYITEFEENVKKKISEKEAKRIARRQSRKMEVVEGSDALQENVEVVAESSLLMQEGSGDMLIDQADESTTSMNESSEDVNVCSSE